jgi:ribosomal protein S6--L-glutamate ligase
MKACVIGGKGKSPSTMKIFNAMKDYERFDSVLFIPTEHITLGVKDGKSMVTYRDKDLSEFDVIVPRIGASKAFFGYLMLKMIEGESDTYTPLKPESPLISHNKFLTLEFLNKADVPIPETYLTISSATAKRIVSDTIKPPLILKLLEGTQGKGVMFAKDKNSSEGIIDALNVLNQSIFIEKYIKNPGEDIRVVVLGDEVVTSAKRKAKKGDIRSNLGSGGKYVSYRVNSEIADIAIRASEAIGAEICGVDIIQGPEGPVVVEVNIALGMKISKVTGIDVPKKIAHYVSERGMEGKRNTKLTYFFERELSKLPRVLKDIVRGKEESES